MKNEVLFGKCLNEVLTLRNWSAARLAKEINVDPSLVRKWIRGERTPSLKSGYIEIIIDCICAGINNKDIFTQTLYKTFGDMGVFIDKSRPLHDLLMDLISHAQIHSLKSNHENRKPKALLKEHDVFNLLQRMHHGTADTGKSIVDKPVSMNFHEIPMIIKGRHNILNALISLIRKASSQDEKVSKRLLLTFQGERDMFEEHPELAKLWLEELKELLTHGWNIQHLWRLNKNVTRSIQLVENIIGLLGHKGNYHPSYFTQYGTLSPPQEMMIVPDVGAILCLSTERRDKIDTAIFYSQTEIIEVLHKHFHQLAKETEPLLKLISLQDYFESITAIDKKLGDAFSIPLDLEVLTLPYSLWVKYLSRSLINQEEINIHAGRIQSRLNSFEEQVKRYKFRSIYSIHALEHLMQTGEYFIDHVYRKPTTKDIIEHFEHIIFLLKTYENYEIALIHEHQSHIIPQTIWRVKGDDSVMINFWNRTSTLENIDHTSQLLIIHEGTIASTFRNYFLHLWERITPQYRDKEYIIAWFEDKIQWLSKSRETEKKS